MMPVLLLKKNHIRWKLTASFFLFCFCLKTPLAQAGDNLVWQAVSGQNQSNTASSQPEETVKEVSSQLTHEELQDTFQALQLIEMLGLSFSAANKVTPMKEQLKQLSRTQSGPYELSSAQVQTLRSIFPVYDSRN